MAVEVAATRRRFTRAEYYRMAETGIPEYGVVDCEAETVEVYCDPGPDGYRGVHRVAGAAALALQAFPDVELGIADIFA